MGRDCPSEHVPIAINRADLASAAVEAIAGRELTSSLSKAVPRAHARAQTAKSGSVGAKVAGPRQEALKPSQTAKSGSGDSQTAKEGRFRPGSRDYAPQRARPALRALTPPLICLKRG